MRSDIPVDELMQLLALATDHDDLAAIERAIAAFESELSAQAPRTRAEKMQAASAKAQRAAVRSSQDIGRPPEGLGNPERRSRSDADLEYHLKEFYPQTFDLDFSEDHTRIIKQIQATIEEGGQKAIALMRSAGKSSILLRAVLWAALTGRRRFICLIAASETSARKLMKALKKIILTNRKLQADFASELHCLISLGGRSTLSEGQHCEGKKTSVVWETGMIASGYIEGVETSEFVISTVSIMGDVRGQQYVTTTGATVRPDCVLLDDPQTKASAKSKPATRTRLEICNGDVMKLSGGQKNMAAFAAVTIIRKNDLADMLVSREHSPYWRGEKVPCVKEFPDKDAMALWDEFHGIYEAELDIDAPHDGSRKFVVENYKAMHEGASLFWDTNYDRKTEVSALHRAMIERAKDIDSFNSELQLEPTSDRPESSDLWVLNAEDIARRVSPYDRRELPDGVEVITCFVDIQQKFLPWLIMGFTISGRGYVLDRGSFPDQKTEYFTKGSIHHDFSELFGEHVSLGDQVTQAMDELTSDLLSREFIRGQEVRSIDKLGFDIGFKLVANDLRTWALQSPHRALIVPMQGRFIGPDTRHWQKPSGGKIRRTRGINVSLKPPPKGERGVPTLQVDSNYWKSQVAEGLTLPITSQKAILLYNDTPSNLLMIGEHCEAEYPMMAKGKDGTEMVIWKNAESGVIDNDYWDALYNNCALASTLGVYSKLKASNVGQSDSTAKKKTIFGASPLKC